MKINWKIITSRQSFVQATAGWLGLIAADTETAHNKHMLGLSLSPQVNNGTYDAIYVPFVHYNRTTQMLDVLIEPELVAHIAEWMRKRKLVGHNFTYDKRWLDKRLNTFTQWASDTRIMWHMASAPAGPRPYGLKDAQVELLGWSAKGDIELANEVKEAGGSLKKGEHYLASLQTLAHYAALDAYSTMQVYKHLKPFFDTHAYWPHLSQRMAYDELLALNTTLGVGVDRGGLLKAHNRLLKHKEAAKKRFLKIVAKEVAELEADWLDMRIAGLTRPTAIEKLKQETHRHPKFSLNSDPNKRELFYGKLGFASIYFTKPSKKAKTKKTPSVSVAADDLKASSDNHPCMESYLTYEKANTLSSSFSSSYLECSEADSRLHPGFNICGTVSFRLSGFKPYLLNAPFDEKAILRNMRVDPGYVGVHADLAAIEPTITAHFSEDKSLLKVFRDGLGDIYLDLALELFPNDKELQDGYNPHIPVTKAIKERFARQRKVAKVIQLAVQYTGTGHTVAKNLSKDGIPTTVEQADGYVRAYWKKFHSVKVFNYKLKETNKKQGYLRNATGLIIRVPDPEYKDLSNRFIQSSAHCVLELWVLEIYRLCAERGIAIKPVLLDCHDSTSNCCPEAQVSLLEQAYDDALANVNAQLDLNVTIKAERKRFTSLAGLKGND